MQSMHMPGGNVHCRMAAAIGSAIRPLVHCFLPKRVYLTRHNFPQIKSAERGRDNPVAGGSHEARLEELRARE